MLSVFVSLLLACGWGGTTWASSSGITGQTLKNSGTRTGCGAGCHGGSFTALGVSFSSTSISIPFNGSANLSINISGATSGNYYGTDVAVSNGTLGESATNLQIVSGELTHSFPPSTASISGTGSYSFTYTPPVGAVIGNSYTIYGAARSGFKWNDATNATVTIVGATQAALTALIGGASIPAASAVGLSGALSTTGGSGVGAVTYTSLSTSVCTVSSTTVNYIAVGTCFVQATKAGDTQYNSATDTVAISIGQGAQAINFAPLPPKLTSDPPFFVSASGGASGNPVTFTASGVCSSSGGNGSTITLTGVVGTCTVTANQAGDANYLAAPAVAQNFSVVAAGEPFPPNCQIPLGWVQSSGAATNWTVTTDFASSGACSLKSAPLASSGTNLSSRIEFAGTFIAGNVTFKRKVSSENTYDCFRFLVDGVEKQVVGACTGLGSYVPGVAIGASGELDWAVVTVPLTAGAHTLTWSYDKDTFCCAAGLDAAWIDEVTLPLAPPVITSATTASGSVGAYFSYSIVASNSPWGYSATGLPPGLTVDGTGLISGTPTTVGTYVVMATANSGGGTVTQAITVTISKGSQSIPFAVLDNKSFATVSVTMPSITGGGSGNPVTYTASGVCTSSGLNGSVILLSGALGTCSVTANQAGDSNYLAATPVTQAFLVFDPSKENFPTNCTMPAGWTTPVGGGFIGWIVAYDSAASGGCSLRATSNISGTPAAIQYTGTFSAGNITFARRTEEGFVNFFGLIESCFRFYIDGVAQNIAGGGTCGGSFGQGGSQPFTTISVPITAGVHTVSWQSIPASFIFGPLRSDVWIDNVVFPQTNLTVTKTGGGTGTISSTPIGINSCSGVCSALFSTGSLVSLTASPAVGSYLASWSGGGCSGNGACNVTMSAAQSVTATISLITAPGVPTGVSATPGNNSASVSFTAPAFNGGSPITSYRAICGSSLATGAGSPIVVPGLANGVTVNCTVSASNAFASSLESSPPVSVTPRTVPDVPTGVVAVPGNTQATINFTPSASNGGSAITGYTATCTASGQTPRTATALASSLIVGSMVNGVAYSCTVVSTNIAGSSTPTAPVAVTPRTTAGAPVMPSAVPYDARAIINWAAPSSDGGSPITGYSVSCNGGAVTAAAGASPITLTGLVNGTTYTCTVSANNAAGSTPSSSFSFVPLVNTGIALWSGICTACHEMVPAGAHLNGAGPSITALDYARANQPLMMANSLVQALTVAERTAIANYILAQVPTTAEVTPFQTPKLIDLSNRIVVGGVIFESIKPGMSGPARGTLSAISGSSITYTPNAGIVGSDSFTVVGSRDNGTPFTGSEITINVTVQPPPAPVITSSLTATGTNGAAFNYQITASNGPTGFGATGLPNGLSVNPTTGAITGTPTVGGSFMAMISASNAGGTGNATLAITLNAAGQVITFPAQSPATRPYAPGGTFAVNPLATASSGLTPTYVSKTAGVCSVTGTTVTINSAGTCTIGANQAGDVNFAAAVEVTRDATITPTLPGAPVIGTASPGNNQAVVSFTAPTNTGGIAISGYTATCTASGQPTRTGTGAISPIIVSSLTNLVLYSCSVTATNSQGTGPASGNATVTPDQVPTAPTIVSATSASFTVNAPGSFSIVATGYPTVFTYAVTGVLPTGVTLSPTTGVLSGTPTQAGTFMVNFSVSNSGGTGMQAFTLTVNKANQTISFSNPGSQAFGAGAVSLTAVATSGLTTSFVSDTTGICTVAGSNVALVSVGTCTIRAQQGGNANFNAAPDVSQSFSVTQGTQTISFGAQSPATRAFVAGGTFGLSPAGTASSGLGVTHTSLTTGVCTILGTTVTMVAAGTCTIAANQPGNANYAAAAQVTQSITINGTAPGAPTLNTATGGDQKITLAFTAPASNGGSTITTYTANCGGITATGSTSPIAVTGLVNGNTYTCTVTATNAAMLTSGNSNSLMATANALPGATVWANTCGSGGCHGNPPVTTRLNAGGADATVLDYSVAHPTGAMGAMVLIVNTLTAQQKIDVAQYIRDFIPAVSATTPANTLVGINVSSQVFLNTPSVALTSLQQASAPANGTLSFPGGTIINYTPNNGFVGNDTFTYRAIGAGVQTDVRTVSVTVTPAAPVITSSLAVSGTINQAFGYQIAASNAPTGYGATGLPAWASINTTTGAITGTPNAGGTTMATISATGAGGTGNATLSITINLAAQSISFPAQSPATRVFAQGGTFPVNPTATGGASGNPVTYSSTTTSVCTVSGSTATIVAAGICTIAANQAGNASYAAAPQVTQNVTITGVAPAAPTIGTATAGNTQATISFTAPTNTGGLPITSYTVNCNGVAASGPSSPIVVSGLTNGTLYTCSVQASNLAGSSPSSGTVSVTPVAIAFMGNVESRKLHGIQGLFAIPINPATPITGAIAVEPRAIGNGHQIAFEFNNPPTSLTGLTVLDANMQPVGSATPSFAGNFLIVTLTGVPDGKRVTITATGVNNALTVSASVGFLYGDVNGSRSVTATDIAYIKALSALPFNAAKFMADINANGAVTASDVTAVKAQAGKTLP